MGALKAVDDLSLKAVDDIHSLKAIDDLHTLKGSDDVHTLKAIDDLHTLKGGDDVHTLKAVDDLHSIKGIDDLHTIVETLLEGGGTLAETLVEGGQTLGGEGIYSNGGGFIDPGVTSAQPFVLANPHHTMAWTQTFGDPNDPEVRSQLFESQIIGVEAAKKQLTDQLQQLDQYHERLKKEYEAFKQSQEKEKE